MARDTIYINKSLIPYDFDIAIADEVFHFRIDYNNTGGFFTVELSKNGVTLCSGEPIMYGRKLFADVWKQGFPAYDIVPFDPAGNYNAVTYDNFCYGVLLIIDNGEKSVLEG